MFRYTHGYDLMYKVVFGIFFIFLLFALIDIADPVISRLERGLKTFDEGDWLAPVALLMLLAAAIVVCFWTLKRTLLPDWLPTFLFCWDEYRIRLSADEAQRITFILNGSVNETWYSFGPLKRVPKELRKEVLYQLANRIAVQWNRAKPFDVPDWEELERESKAREEAAQEEKGKEGESQARVSKARDIQLRVSLEVLGLSEAPKEFSVVRSAYRRRVSEFHPDRFQGEKPEVLATAEEMTKRINQAYRYLVRRYGESES